MLTEDKPWRDNSSTIATSPYLCIDSERLSLALAPNDKQKRSWLHIWVAEKASLQLTHISPCQCKCT